MPGSGFTEWEYPNGPREHGTPDNVYTVARMIECDANIGEPEYETIHDYASRLALELGPYEVIEIRKRGTLGLLTVHTKASPNPPG